MGTASLGLVVDDKLRVICVKRLSVADARVFPLRISGNIAAAVYAVMENAADIIKKDQEVLI